MNHRHEAGQSLIEVVVATGIVSVTLAAVFAGTVAAIRHFGPDPIANALQNAAEREMHVAIDVMKYQGGTIAPTTVATSVPAGVSLIAAHLSIATSPLPGGGATISITATSDRDSSESATISATVPNPAPLPSSTVFAPGAAPAPTGAP